MAKVSGGTKQTQSFVKDAHLRSSSAENRLKNTAGTCISSIELVEELYWCLEREM